MVVDAASGARRPPTEGGAVEEAGEGSADGTFTLMFHLGGGRRHGERARMALWGVSAVAKWVGKEAKKLWKEATTRLTHDASMVWGIVKSEVFQQAGACFEGAKNLSDAIDAEDWREFPEVTVAVELVGCAGGMHEVDWKSSNG